MGDGMAEQPSASASIHVVGESAVSATAEKYLTFRVADEAYGVPVTRVEEVLEHHTVTRVPRCPEFLLGIINVRGRLIPVMDLRRRLGMEAAGVTVDTRTIVLTLSYGEEELSIGARTDQVQGVIDLEPEQIEAPPRLGAGREDIGLAGTARTDDGICLLLDVDRLLTPAYLDEQFDLLQENRSGSR
jgi:purine-binding chemotaxis protein CheW